jgi:hypothetical protein
MAKAADPPPCLFGVALSHFRAPLTRRFFIFSFARPRANGFSVPARWNFPIDRDELAEGSRASAVLSGACGLNVSMSAEPIGFSRPTPGLSRTALTKELEGQSDRATTRKRTPVGAEFQWSTEKTWGRAGSPARATRHSATYQHLLETHPTLPIRWGLGWGVALPFSRTCGAFLPGKTHKNPIRASPRSAAV